MSAQAATTTQVSPLRVAVASFIGTTVEFYDFLIYGTAAALVFPKLFFPTASPASGVLLSFATFGVGFFARPLGGVVFGHFGDRLGRKRMLVYSLVGMGVSTVLIGLLPTYAQIGIAAPILLTALRLAQGFAVGGEWGGATSATRCPRSSVRPSPRRSPPRCTTRRRAVMRSSAISSPCRSSRRSPSA
jgi:MFS family permease